MNEITIDVHTKEQSERDYTAAEKALTNKTKEVEALVEAKAAERLASKGALLNRLGITAEEAKLLLS